MARQWRRASKRNRIRVVSVIAALIAGVVTWGVIAATGATSFVDLTVAGANVTVNGATWVEGGTGAGTGQFDPFLTYGSNQDTEQGYNSCAGPQFDTSGCTGSTRTHALSAAAIPTVTIGGVKYREFSLDANDQGSDDYMSIDEFKVYLDDQNNLNNYTDGAGATAGTFGTDNGNKASLIYTLPDGATVLMRSQTLTPGSGVSDITVDLPDSLFPTSCYYGSLTCNQFVILYTKSGALGVSPQGNGCSVASPCNYNVTGGFEEWRTQLAPVVNVDKSATPSFTRTHHWSVKKEVSVDGGATWVDGTANLNLFNGDSKDVRWRISWVKDPTAPTDSNDTVSGTVTVTNPTGGTGPIATGIPATINSLTDVINQGSDASVTLTCPVTFPTTLAANSSFQCTYSKSVSSTTSGSNTATATLSTGDVFSKTVTFDFSSVTPTQVDNSATLDDDLKPSGFPTTVTDSSGSSPIEYPQTQSCGTTHTTTNTAVLTPVDSKVPITDPAAVVVTCYGLTTTKTATPAFTRTYDWTVKKEVSLDGITYVDASVNLEQFVGQSHTLYWRITPTRNAGSDGSYGVTGTITVHNDTPLDATGVSVSDSISGGFSGTITIDCDPGTAGNQTTVNVAHNSTASCSYSATLPDGTTRTNTGTATLFSQPYSGTASINFTGVTPTTVDATASLDDDLKPTGFPAAATSGTAVSYTTTADCGASRTITNTAVLTEGDSGQIRQDAASAVVTCDVLTVTKNATPTFRRTYDWTVKKEVSLDGVTYVDASVNLEQFVGQSHTLYWRITPTRNAGTDDNWAVTGTIVVHNDTNLAATGVAVSDSITGSITGTVDCDPGTAGNQTSVNVAAHSTASCSYSASLPDATTRTNTGTATLFSQNYTGTASINFTGVTPSTVDATASLDDDLKPTGFPAAATSGTAVSYTTTADCGASRTITNTAVLTEGDSGQVRQDAASAVVTCDVLTVTKNATPTFRRTYDWTVKKEVSLDNTNFFDASVNLEQFLGDSHLLYWRITPTRNAGTDDNWAVTGTIVVHNDTNLAATGVAVSDSITGGLTGTVDCDPGTAGNQTSVNVAAHSTASCSYSASLPDATTRTNTGTATLFSQNYTGTASINFTGVSPTLVDATASLDDDLDSGLPAAATSGTAVSYSTTADCGSSRTITNTAVLTEGTSLQVRTDAAAANVTCDVLTVVKTATPSFTRSWTWAVDKTSQDASLTLQIGQTFFEPYSVRYSASSLDSSWQVTGSITVTSPAGAPTRTVDVSDLYQTNAAAIDCNGVGLGSGLPLSLVGGTSVVCYYTVNLSSALNGTNNAKATMTNVVVTGTHTQDFASNGVAVTFSTPTTEIDKTITVTDTVPAGSYCTALDTPVVGCTVAMVGTGPPTGSFSATSNPFSRTFTYTRIIGPYTAGNCGDHTVDNTANFVTNTTSTTGSDTVSIPVHVPCPAGCTLTQGYWKTHSIRGPAPFDDTWNLLPIGPYALADSYAPLGGTHEGLTFFYSGQSWYTVFWTPPKGGNAYYILAHQYMAAVLNLLKPNPATPPTEVTAALNAALALFQNSANTPTSVGKLSGTARQTWINLASTLDAFNSGLIGPGHCNEDVTSSSSP